MEPVNDTILAIASSVGWVGAVGTVGAYALVSQRRLEPTSLRFQGLNLLGGSLLAVSALSHGNWSSTVCNLIWMFFGAQAMLRAARRSEGHSRDPIGK